MAKIRTVFCGAGQRTNGTGMAVRSIDDYEVIGVCDPYEDKAIKLADLFEDFTQTFCDPYMHTLIVETHSEYLVRRTQIIAVECVEKYGEDVMDEMIPFKIIYFPTERGEQPYDMEYLPNGRFKYSFGFGFYDAAGKLALELSDKESKQNESEDFNWNML